METQTYQRTYELKDGPNTEEGLVELIGVLQSELSEQIGITEKTVKVKFPGRENDADFLDLLPSLIGMRTRNGESYEASQSGFAIETNYTEGRATVRNVEEPERPGLKFTTHQSGTTSFIYEDGTEISAPTQSPMMGETPYLEIRALTALECRDAISRPFTSLKLPPRGHMLF